MLSTDLCSLALTTSLVWSGPLFPSEESSRMPLQLWWYSISLVNNREASCHMSLNLMKNNDNKTKFKLQILSCTGHINYPTTVLNVYTQCAIKDAVLLDWQRKTPIISVPKFANRKLSGCLLCPTLCGLAIS